MPSTHPRGGRAGKLLISSMAIGRVGHEALLWEVLPHDDAFELRALGTLRVCWGPPVAGPLRHGHGVLYAHVHTELAILRVQV